ncbi:MAG: nucleotidyltransferase family protein [Chloroflexota bacterium]
MKREEVTRILEAQRYHLRRDYGVQSLSLFGSVARDQATAQSDIDLLVEFNQPVGFFGLLALQDYLEKLFSCPVDLGTPDGLKGRMKAKVLAEQIHVI